MKIIEIFPHGSIIIDHDNTPFLAYEVAEINGKLKATAEKTGSITELLSDFNPLRILWLN